MNGKMIASFTVSFHCCYCCCPLSDLTFYYLIFFFLLLMLSASAKGSRQQIWLCESSKCRGGKEGWGNRASWNFVWRLMDGSWKQEKNNNLKSALWLLIQFWEERVNICAMWLLSEKLMYLQTLKLLQYFSWIYVFPYVVCIKLTF